MVVRPRLTWSIWTGADVYGFVLLVFSILLVVSACVSIVMTYFLLNAEDYRCGIM